jgi:hypothetical protein
MPILLPMGGVPFHPEDIGWHTLFWAEGTEFTAQGYANGDNLGAIADEFGVSADDAVVGPVTSSQEYEFGNAIFDGEPHFHYTGAGAAHLTGSWVKSNPGSQFTAVVVYWPTDMTSESTYIMSGVYGGGFNLHTTTHSSHMLRFSNMSSYLYPVKDQPQALAAYFDSAVEGNDVVSLNGTTSGVTNFPVTGGLGGLAFGSRYDGNYEFRGGIAMVGLYDGDLRAHADWSRLSAWCNTKYGVPL